MLALIAAIALQLGVSPRLAQEVALHENRRLDPLAIGVTGDLGLFQINPAWLSHFVELHWNNNEHEVVAVLGDYAPFDWRKPEHNAFMGICILRSLLSDKSINTWQALIAYNCGLSRVKARDIPPKSLDYATSIYLAWTTSRGEVLR